MDTPSQATTIAAKLAKYAYPNSPLLPNSKSPHRPLAPATPTSEAGGPSTPTPTRSRKVKREPDVEYRIEDEDEGDEDSHTPSKRPKVKVKSGSSGGSGSGKKPRPFAGPEVYAHLRPVQDLLKPDLDIVFCGIKKLYINQAGLLLLQYQGRLMVWRSGLTPRFVPPSEDHLLPELFNYGLTNLCNRPTAEQSELSTMEMRLNVLNLTLKIRSHRPRVVCFVGKKIWDVYVSVVSKTARPAIGVKLEVDLVKLEVPQEKIGSEEVKLEMEEVKVEPIVKLESQQDLADRTLPSPSRRRSIPSPSRRSKKPPPTPFNWNSPRSLRLPHPDGRGYTYFWVTPNTSGLERTPLSEQINIFGRLRAFVEVLKDGREGDAFLDIDVEGVERTTENIRKLKE